MKSTLIAYLRGLIYPQDGFSPRQKWVLGLINLALVVILWVLSSFLVSMLSEDQHYSKPFFLTYFNTSMFSFYIVPYLYSHDLSLSQFAREAMQAIVQPRRGPSQGQRRASTEVPIRRLSSPSNYGSDDDGGDDDVSDDASEFIGFSETIWLSFQFAMLWFLANLVTNSSLSYTSVASQTILSSTSSFFTLIIGFLYHVERINRYKLAGIILSFAGVLIVTKVDASDDVHRSHEPLVILAGNLLALSGAVFYGAYTILLKLKTTDAVTKKERQLDTHLFFGFVGLFTLLVMWPLLVVLDLTNVEVFELPPTGMVAMLLLGNAFITFISDFCWCKAVLLTSPLTVTVGLSMTIPLAMVGDWVFKQFAVNWWYLFGASVVTLGFLVINRDEENDFVDEQETPERHESVV